VSNSITGITPTGGLILAGVLIKLSISLPPVYSYVAIDVILLTFVPAISGSPDLTTTSTTMLALNVAVLGSLGTAGVTIASPTVTCGIAGIASKMRTD
jgi:hypothetical protein